MRKWIKLKFLTNQKAPAAGKPKTRWNSNMLVPHPLLVLVIDQRPEMEAFHHSPLYMSVVAPPRAFDQTVVVSANSECVSTT